MSPLLQEIRHNPLLWLLGLVPVACTAAKLGAEAHTVLFVLSVWAIVPLAALPSDAAESVAGETGEAAAGARFSQTLSLGLAVLLIVAYALGKLFSLKTHRKAFASAEHGGDGKAPWPIGLALATLAGVTVLVAGVSEIVVESVQKAVEAFCMTPAFVGYIVVARVCGAAAMATAFSRARKDRLDLSVGIALGSASQIALFVAPVLVLMVYLIFAMTLYLRAPQVQ